jgi:hypothetical protein
MRFTSEEEKNFFLPSHHDEKKNQGEREMNLMNMIKLLLSFECCTSTRFFFFFGPQTRHLTVKKPRLFWTFSMQSIAMNS